MAQVAAVDLRRAFVITTWSVLGALGCSDAQHTVGVYDVSLAGRSGAGASPAGRAGDGDREPFGDGAVGAIDAAIPAPVPECADDVMPTTRKTLGLYLLVDTNFIARGNENWNKVVQGIRQYSRRPEAEGTTVGLRIINPPPPTLDSFLAGGGPACQPGTYATPTVAIGPEPLPANVEALSAALSNATLSIATPLTVALEGAITHAFSLENSYPDQDKAVVLISDAFLDVSCSPIARQLVNPQELADAAARGLRRGIPSYMIQLDVPAPDLWPLPFNPLEPWLDGIVVPLDPVAVAGGTRRAYTIDMEQDSAADISDTLLGIQRDAEPCDYRVPDGVPWEELRLAVDTGVGPGPMPRLASEGECADAGGAYLDTSSGVAWARACPASCAAIRATAREPLWLVDCALAP